MDTSKLKTYAPKARRDFIAAVTRRAARFGLSEAGVSPVQEQGQVILIDGLPYPKAVGEQRRQLVARIAGLGDGGFEHTIEAAAYTWFNRLMAIRYMELHGYLGHSYRVLSHPAGGPLPEILEHAQHVELPGLDRQRVIDLKMDGTRDEALYRDLLLAQCRALHQAMPFLFEPLDDDTELLLPDRLLQTDSLINELVGAIPEQDWQQIEVIGWLYQFYISEKKDQVIGKVVKSEDIPAATQLFTPNWIVKYMVQNSLGAQWLATYPDSPLKGRMDYYIEPAEQSDEVNAQLAAITPDGLDPEALTLIDPACGSGHILVEAYELFKAIYLERGYRRRDIAQLILEKNLFGLDIDTRAAQLSGFALMMKGRADDRRLFERGVKLNVMALVDSGDLDIGPINRWMGIADYGLEPVDLMDLKALFEHATTFGSLIQVPEGLAAKLPALRRLSEVTSQDLFVSADLQRLAPLVQQAELLAAQYDAVVANPPYMGTSGMNALVKKFAKKHFPKSKSDLFSVSTERFLALVKSTGLIGLMTPFTWMSLSSYETFRRLLLMQETLQSLIQPEYHAFFDSAYVPICTFVTRNCQIPDYRASFINLSDFYGADLQPQKVLEAIINPACDWHYQSKPDDFTKIPGSPLAYWASGNLLDGFNHPRIGSLTKGEGKNVTADNERFLRFWLEV